MYNTKPKTMRKILIILPFILSCESKTEDIRVETKIKDTISEQSLFEAYSKDSADITAFTWIAEHDKDSVKISEALQKVSSAKESIEKTRESYFKFKKQ